MFGSSEPDYDYSCPHCGHGMYFDVGMGPTECPACGQALGSPAPNGSYLPENADVLDDPDFLLFDEYRAFRLLKAMGLLNQCLKEEGE